LQVTTLLPEAYRSFVRSRRALGRSPRTLESYDLAVRDFGTFLTTENSTTSLNQVTRHTIQDFMIEYMAAGRTTTTANKTYRALRALFNWFSDEEIIDTNPFSKLKPPPVQSKTKHGYSIPEVKSILANLRDRAYGGGREAYLALRDYSIIMVLYDTGLRASEVLAMTTAGLDHTTGEFAIKGKGARTYRRHISTQTLDAIALYLKAWEAQHFEPLAGKLWRGWNGSVLTRSGLYRLCSRRAAEVGIKDGDVHRWRYTHAEVLDELGWHEDIIMAEMGHSQRSVSRHYRQASIRRQAIRLHAEQGPTKLLN
jgi:site-specific recombinase XerD